MKQINTASMMYIGDNRDYFCTYQGPWGAVHRTWDSYLCPYLSSQNFNVNTQRHPVLKVYGCPSDQSKVQYSAGNSLGQRSYATNGYVSDVTGAGLTPRESLNLRSFKKAPDNVPFFLEGHQYQGFQNSGYWMSTKPTTWNNNFSLSYSTYTPTSRYPDYHGKGSNVAFCDGHVKWYPYEKITDTTTLSWNPTN